MLRGKDGLRAVAVDSDPSGQSQSSSIDPSIRVDVIPDTAFHLLLDEANATSRPHAGRQLLAELQEDIEIPLSIRAMQRDAVWLNIDRAAVTHLAIQRLAACADIAEAQPNYRSSIRTPEP
jgi:hypothetical protein